VAFGLSAFMKGRSEPTVGVCLLIAFGRGPRKHQARVDDWLKEIAPSTRLRKWFGHDPARWKEFKKRYATELAHQRKQTEQLARDARRRTITLLFGAKDIEHNNAVALKEYIEKLG
jgi:uncharacterized protein YeaO (DUF488 family)